jgi:hypothetical protein
MVGVLYVKKGIVRNAHISLIKKGEMMYIKKLEYLQQRFRQNHLYSGLILRSINSLPIGTPCLIDLNNKDALYKKMKKEKAVEPNNIEEINNCFRSETSSANIVFLFNIYSDSSDFITASTKINKVYYIDDKPLIYDSYSSTLLESLRKDTISDNILEQLKDQLDNNRFINYVFEDIKLSNVDNAISNIKRIINVLDKNYSNNIAFYQHPYDGSRVLIDTISISFYKIKDVIPVFNYKKLDGICMEIMLTNSDLKGESLIKQGYSMTYRFLFGKYKENIFSIDGESVKRPNDILIAKTLVTLCQFLKKSVPRDTKNSSKQPVKKEPKKVTKTKKNDKRIHKYAQFI